MRKKGKKRNIGEKKELFFRSVCGELRHRKRRREK